MKKYFWGCFIFTLSVVLFLGAAIESSAAIKVRVQPDGTLMSGAYVLSGETRTIFGHAVPDDLTSPGPMEYMWEFSDAGATGWADVTDWGYISIDHTFATSGLHWARLTVRDKSDSSDVDSAVVEVQVLAVDTAGRQKNSAIDRGLRRLYLQQQWNPAYGSHWGTAWNIVGQTAMALVAFENHQHNLDTSEDDIYKPTVINGLQWLFNHAYEVELSDQACIGDPEGDDGDTDNDGYGITFNTCGNGNACDEEGYEAGLAMLAIVNSCKKSTAETLTASSSSSSFVNGMTYWDIIVDAKDFLAYAQSENTSGGHSCEQWPGANGHYRCLDAEREGETKFEFDFEASVPSAIPLNCNNFKLRINFGDGDPVEFSSDWCYYDYDGTYMYYEVEKNHIYDTLGTYSVSAVYSIDNGTTWIDVCGFEITLDEGCNSEFGNAWRYVRNSASDNSVAQWPVLALEEARDSWGININPKVITGLSDWLDYSQGDTSGGFGYTSPGDWENFAKTGAGLAMLKYVGRPATDTNVQNALNFLDSRWNVICVEEGDDDERENANLGNLYAMYAFYKGMKYFAFNDLNGRIWEDLYAEYLVDNQNADGSWNDCSEWIPAPEMTTSITLAMLAPAPGGLPPVADAGGPYGTVNAGQEVMLDGSGSYHQDPGKNIIIYEWDFDSANGLWWETTSAPLLDEGATGVTSSVVYPDTGSYKTYTVMLRVTDDGDPIQTDEGSAVITVTTGNAPPVAMTDGPWAGLPGDLIVFDGTDSYDPNNCTDPGNPACLGDSISSYEWDLDGDGSYNETNGDDGEQVTAGDWSVVQKNYPEPVSQTITLRVTDNYGLTDTTSPQVNIVSIALVYAKEYNTCFREQLSRVEYRLGIQVEFQNVGNSEAKNVVMTLTQTPTNLTILKGISDLGDMLPGSSVLTACPPGEMSADIELLFNRRVSPTGEWRWKAEFDIEMEGAGLKHYIIDNLPPLIP